MTNWEKAKGILCPSCGQETHRLLATEETPRCLACFRKAEERRDQELEMKALVRSLRRSRSKYRR